MPCCLFALCSWDRFGHGSSHRSHDDKVTTTTTQAYAGPVENVRVVDQV